MRSHATKETPMDVLRSAPTRRTRAAGALLALAAMAAVLALTGCDRARSHKSSAGGDVGANPLTSSTTAASPTAAASPTGGGKDYCSVVIEVNTQVGTMVNKRFKPTTEWTGDQIRALVDWTLSNRDEFLALTPPQLKQAVQVELQWDQSIKDHNYSLSAPAPPGTVEAFHKIGQYQTAVCGIQY
jgi:hypothetical protein